ncbi:sodium-dependent noradrenaline transporter-like isoform X2 [Dermacentor andersoni]|uniref:sodium-dependent noradrenaline transporter-like isoform X2 n=1 Tax=Dermacentor andersoni TaxID=34620 RepID=UPI00215584EB|nr:sodium-dependent noradrenaline transporter-like isoform X2 [Dermacentor andersoni]
MTSPPRQQWKSPNEFLFGSVGMCVGLSNLLRFPYVVYHNGGLVFIMVYLLLMVVVAFPMVHLEVFLGQFSSLAVPSAFGGFPMAKGIGWTMLYVNLASCLNYIASIAHGAFYLFHSFSSTLPWTTCKNNWSDANCFEKDYRNVPCFRVNVTLARKYSSHNYTDKDALMIHSGSAGGGTVMVPGAEYDAVHSTCVNGTQTSTEQFLLKKVLRLSSGIEEIGDLHQDMLLLISLCWLAEFLSIVKGIRSYAKVAMGMTWMSFALLFTLLLSSVVQRGSMRGMGAYLYPDWPKLVDIVTWRAASQQLLFSLGLSLGVLTGHGSYKPFEWPLSLNIAQLIGADFCFSFFAGCMVFALHGHATVLYGLDIDDLVTSEYHYAFVTYPESVKHFRHPELWCIAFYLLICVLSFDGVAAFLEVGVSTFMDIYPGLRPHRLRCTLVTCIVMFILSLPAATGGGLYVLHLIDSVTYLDLVPWIALAEVLLLVNGYGVVRLNDDIHFMSGQTPSAYLLVCWRYFCPVALLTICLGSVNAQGQHLLDYSYPAWTGVIQLAIILCCIVAVITQVMRTFAENRNDIYAAMEPEDGYGPSNPETYARYQEALPGRNALRSTITDGRGGKKSLPRASLSVNQNGGSWAASAPSVSR